MKHNDWEEQFDEMFKPVSHWENGYKPTLEESPRDIKDFIAKLVEKTRREAYEEGLQHGMESQVDTHEEDIQLAYENGRDEMLNDIQTGKVELL